MIRRIPREQAEGRVEALTPATTTADVADGRDTRDAQAAALGRALVLLLGEELALSPTHVREVVERELLRVRCARRVLVRVHPDDLPLLEREIECSARLEIAGDLAYQSDDTLTRGGCVLESNLGELDARLETRLGLALKLLTSGALR